MKEFDDWLMRFLDEPLYVVGAGVGLFVLLLVILSGRTFLFYFRFIFKSLSRNLLRSILTGMATAVFVLLVTMIWSVFDLLDRATQSKSKDLKAIITERWQIPSQMPFGYATSLQEGGPSEPGDYRVNTEIDSMTWQFYAGYLDPNHRTRESLIFFFCMEPRKLTCMMDGIDEMSKEDRYKLDVACKLMTPGQTVNEEDARLIDPDLKYLRGQQVDGKLMFGGDKRYVIVGRERLASLNKRPGEWMKVMKSQSFKDIDLECMVLTTFPDGRYNQNAIMNRDYINSALDDYERSHGTKHAMSEKSLNLVWVRVPDMLAFQRVSDQVENHGHFTTPAVKCETASSGVASFLDAYRDLLWGARWLLVPAILASMGLVIACAISISVRERRTEMAVLKVLGFSPGRIMVLVLGEAMLLGGFCGLVSSLGAWFLINKYFGGVKVPVGFFGAFLIPNEAWLWGLTLGAGTALAGSLLPAWSARSVKVSEVFSKVA
jgi:putative ABC transport system permease protein